MSLKTLPFYGELEQDDLDQFAEEGITTNPGDYYFSVAHYELCTEVVFVPKKLYDAQGLWSDSGYLIPILREAGHLKGYGELMEATVEPDDENMPEHAIRAELSARGFTENKQLYGPLAHEGS